MTFASRAVALLAGAAILLGLLTVPALARSEVGAHSAPAVPAGFSEVSPRTRELLGREAVQRALATAAPGELVVLKQSDAGGLRRTSQAEAGIAVGLPVAGARAAQVAVVCVALAVKPTIRGNGTVRFLTEATCTSTVQYLRASACPEAKIAGSWWTYGCKNTARIFTRSVVAEDFLDCTGDASDFRTFGKLRADFLNSTSSDSAYSPSARGGC